MRVLKSIIMLFCVLALVSSCQNDDNPAGGGGGNENSFTINGAGFSNKTFTAPSIPAPPGFPANPFAFGSYDTNDSVTIVLNIALNAQDTAYAIIAFVGDQARNFQNTSLARGMQVSVGNRDFAGGFNNPTNAIPNTTFNLNVTRYDAVGGRIQGSYSGTLREAIQDTVFGSATITINGNFNVTRIPNDFDDIRGVNRFFRKEQAE